MSACAGRFPSWQRGFVCDMRTVAERHLGLPVWLPGLADPEMLERVERAVTAAVDVLRSDGTIVMTGCGTSGRMAYWCARSFNRVLARLGRKPAFKYLISGGDTALLLSDELPEVCSMRYGQAVLVCWLAHRVCTHL